MKAPDSKPIVYYRDADFLVTSAKARAARKTYRVDKIEKVSLRRDHFYILLSFTTLYTLFLLKFGKGIPGSAPAVFLALLYVGTYTARHFGLLFVTSKAVSELAFIGIYARLQNVRDAIERAMHREDEDGGVAVDHDDDEEKGDDDD